MSELFTMSEVAKKLKVSKKTVYSILNSLKEDFPTTEFFVRVPKCLRFSNNHIEKIVKCLNSKNSETVDLGTIKQIKLTNNTNYFSNKKEKNKINKKKPIK